MNNEKWDEICFLLSENIRTDISENDFEKHVIQALRVLDWKDKDGTSKQKIWNAYRFKESSGVLGNLKSRPQFRNGEWQKLGIEKVLVSID